MRASRVALGIGLALFLFVPIVAASSPGRSPEARPPLAVSAPQARFIPVDDGDACTTSDDCDDGERCKRAPDEDEGVCVVRRPSSSSSPVQGGGSTTQGPPPSGMSAGTIMLPCGCHGFNVPPSASEPRCASQYVQVFACGFMCPAGGQAYGYRCS
jgi:hypothetical protein